ncbi:MAG: hypothetical protein IT490_04440, partial [Candidatus Contendobacter sp.]|nr:hypothetical protein [Candidatus Contendobacter sp.]
MRTSERGHRGGAQQPHLTRRHTGINRFRPRPNQDKTCQPGVHAMQIKLSGHHLEITPALHDYVYDKLER